MARATKDLIVKDYDVRFAAMEGGVFFNFQGLTSLQAGGLRDALAEQQLRVVVVKNRLFRRMLEKRGIATDGALRGPIAVVFGPGEAAAIQAAKALVEWRRKAKIGEIRGALFEGRIYDAREAAVLATMPTRPELLASLLGSVIGPATAVASLAANTMAIVPNLLRNHIEKLEGGGEEMASGEAAA